MANFNRKLVKNSGDALSIAFNLILKNLKEDAFDKGIDHDVTELIRAAVSMSKQETLSKVIAKAEHLSNSEQHYINNFK